MTSSHSSDREPNPTSPEERITAIFASWIIQQTNMALMLLGQVPHPETGQRVQDFDAAQMFIDQLEMVEVKTKGNLTSEEAQLLKESLMALRMAFVQTVQSEPSTAAAPAQQSAQMPDVPPTEPAPAPEREEESRKKFSKKY